MAAEPSPYFGPPLNVESWIERGNPGHWLTGKGATPHIAHVEINHNPRAEEQWVREYDAGRKAFQEPRIDAARSLVDEKSAEAVISARMALDIPWRGGAFMYNQGCVVRAMSMKDPLEQPKRIPQGDETERDVAMDALKGSLRQMHLAMQAAFDNPYDDKQDLESIAQKGREAIEGNEVSAWTTAVNSLGERGDLHAAGVGAIELGAAYERKGEPDNAVVTFKAASDLLKTRLKSVMAQGEPSRHTAEVDELAKHIVEAQSGILRILPQKDKVKGPEKELLKAAVYDLDDYGAPQQTVMDGYRVLARSSHFRERRFYKREAAAIAGEIAIANFFASGGAGLTDAEPRYDRSHLRPPVELPANT
ncbi:hypothetical protein KY385_01225 [Candidatus Parcubacteria bacterium]|nr:hypothetical protein [Candidatus Parcubacteria bacterium]